MKILNIGSINLDHVYRVDHFIRPGETQPCKTFQVFPGGKGLNQSIALAKAGANVFHAGKVGRDGAWLVDLMKEAGVHTEYTQVVDRETGTAVIQVDDSGQNGILLNDGANKTFDRDFVTQVLSGFREGDILLLQNEINLIPEMIAMAWEKGMKIAINPSPANDTIKACDLNKVTWLLLNEIEGEWLTGETQPEAIAQQLIKDFPNLKVVLTLGDKGSLYRSADTALSIPALKVKAVDTTGAGDTFTGYFLMSAAAGREPGEAMETATKAAAISVSRPGAAVSIPVYSEVCVK